METFNKPSSAEVYQYALGRFCSEIGLTPSELTRKLLTEIEDLTETFIHRNKSKTSAIYDHAHYLTAEEMTEYKAMVDTQALRIYSLSRSQEQIIETRIQTIKALLKDLDASQIEKFRKELTDGKITV